jgi:hypothetical protein
MSVTRDHLAEHVLGALIDVSGWAEKKGSPRRAVFSSALETVVNLLAFERGTDQMAALLMELADVLRHGRVVEQGSVLARLQQPA